MQMLNLMMLGEYGILKTKRTSKLILDTKKFTGTEQWTRFTDPLFS